MGTIGVDVGGTFTDLVYLEEDGDELYILKVPSTPANPEEAILNGLSRCLPPGQGASDIETFLHGTTVTTNALIELNGSPSALVTTAGLRGIYQVQSQVKVGPRHSMTRQRMPPVIDPDNVFEVMERIGSRGEELVALDEAVVRGVAREIAKRRIESVAIAYLFSFANPEHELRSKAIIESEVPGCLVYCSAELMPRMREWPRMSTTMLNAYLEPVLLRYIQQLVEGLARADVTTTRTFLMESNGGVMPFSAVSSGGKAIHTLLSGPAAAVQAARTIARASSMENIVTIDVGGTSCDIAFVKDGEALEVTAGEVCGYDLFVPMLDIATIGAGGGTIASVDLGGRLRLGPRSAGADPGPAAYGRGGTDPTVTDADVVLGYLDPHYFAGGSFELDVDAATSAIAHAIASPLGLEVEDAALAVARVHDARIADEIGVLASKRGLDLGEFSMIVCGGAGPVHGASIADELGIRTVVVPPTPGVFAALGLLCTDITQDYVQTALAELDRLGAEDLRHEFEKLESHALANCSAQGIRPGDVMFIREVDARYKGQGFELRISVENVLDQSGLEKLVERFHHTHERIYGNAAHTEPVEVVSYRIRAVVRMPQYEAATKRVHSLGDQRDALVLTGERVLRFASGPTTAPVVHRDELAARHQIDGPAIVQQADSTTVIPPGWSASEGPVGCILLTRS